MTMLAPVTHVLPLTAIRRARLLPIPGRVVVRQDQKVNATDVVASCDLPGQHLLLDVRRALSIQRSDRLEKVIERKVGEKLQKGDIIAQTRGLFNRILRAPVEGVIAAITAGQVLLETQTIPVDLKAGLSGTVSEVMPDRGVVIESNGTLIQGVWGNGQIGVGLLLSVIRSPLDELTSDRLDPSMRGSVIFGGFAIQTEVLTMAAEMPLKGLILASMSPELEPLACSMPFPIILLEGFGKLAVDEVSYKLLTSHDKRDISLDASQWDPVTGIRPEIFVSLPEPGTAPKEMINFAPGQIVRGQMPPYAGRVGTLVRILPGLSTLPSGIRAQAAEVHFESEKVLVPLSNLDVLE